MFEITIEVKASGHPDAEEDLHAELQERILEFARDIERMLTHLSHTTTGSRIEVGVSIKLQELETGPCQIEYIGPLGDRSQAIYRCHTHRYNFFGHITVKPKFCPELPISIKCPRCKQDPPNLLVRVDTKDGNQFLGCPKCAHTQPIPEHLHLEAAGVARLPGF